MSCGCNSTTSPSANKAAITLKVDFLFLDDSVCVPCGSTARNLSEAVDMLMSPLDAMGINLSVEKIHVTDQKVAAENEFLTSPTIRVNGRDVDPARTEDDCATCADLAGGATPVKCRNWNWHGNVYQAAPVGKVVEAIMEEALNLTKDKEGCCVGNEEGQAYALPDNLRQFFVARERNEKLCC